MQKFMEHLQDSRPGFRCSKPGSRESRLEHEVQVRHDLGKAASQDEIEILCSKLGEGCEQLIDLYSQHNGMTLYVEGEDAGITFFPIESFEERNSEWHEWLDDLEEDEMWDFQKSGIAFGEIVASGNYFVFWEGKIYYADHDGGDDVPYGDTFSTSLTASWRTRLSFYWMLAAIHVMAKSSGFPKNMLLRFNNDARQVEK